ncbi:oligosaccharide flippase family protein [Vibrio alginolyticus]|uniref:oligosaccharide flippase family protein n=1 Tax=Vibrio alginolyticus TaxID=663 RepID=UPI0037546182
MRKNNIIYQLFFLLKNNVIAAALAYAVSILLARELGPESFGFYSYALIVSSIASVIVNFSSDSTASIVLARYNGDKEKVFNLFFSLRIFLYFSYLLLIFFVSFYDRTLALSLFFVSLSFLNVSFLYEINKNNIIYSYLFVGERFFYCLIVFILWILNAINIEIVFYSIFTSSFIFLVVQFLIYKRYFLNFKLISFSSIFYLVKDNLYLVLVALSTLSYGGFSRMIMEHKLGLYQLGIYSAGWQLIKVGTLFQSQLDRVWRLNLSNSLINKNHKELKSIVYRYFIFGTIPVGLFGLFIYLFAEFIVISLYSREYEELINVIGYISFYLIVINLDGLARMFWNAVGNRRIYFIINITISLIMLLVMTFLLNSNELYYYIILVVFFHLFSVFVLFLSFFFIGYLSNEE